MTRIRSYLDWLTDFRGTGWVGHDPDMPEGGYTEAIFK